MRDPTAQTEPLTTGQRLVSEWERDIIAEPCELAEAIDAAIAAERERCANLAETYSNCQLTAMDTWAAGFAFAKRKIAQNIRDLPQL